MTPTPIFRARNQGGQQHGNSGNNNDRGGSDRNDRGGNDRGGNDRGNSDRFNDRGGDGHSRQRNRHRNRNNRKDDGVPKGDLQVDLSSLPEIDYNHYESMTPASLMKEVKKYKVSADLPREEVIETLLPKVNDEAEYGYGILELAKEGYGFLRRENYGASDEDIFVAQNIVKKAGLRGGDRVFGVVLLPGEGDKYRRLVRVESVNRFGTEAKENQKRKNFDELTPLYPNEQLRLEINSDGIPTRIVDLISPLGKGQRALIVSPPKAGKTTMMKMIANAITQNHPEVDLLVLLVDERPEEVTDMRRSVRGQVISSTFDEPAENHMRVADLCLEQAKRMVETGRDVVIVLDSLTRLSRASNLTINPSGRTLTGGLDPAALYRPRRFFGAARNIEEGGSLTIIASVLVDTGSKMDESIFEELKGTGNSEIILDRELSERRIWPAIDVRRSSTRHEELLFPKEIYDGIVQLRRLMAKETNSIEATEQLIKLLKRTPNNASFIDGVIQRTRATV